MSKRKYKVELLPHERDVLLKWNYTPEVREQLEPLTSTEDIATISLTSVDLMYLVSDLNHAIVKRGARDDDTFDLAERLEYVQTTGEGKLDCWW
tara:strand:- start:61 stop:342 length:282 start_codon:yes stop_codon:yes gene_type:complete